jgi:hypothetical protein
MNMIKSIIYKNMFIESDFISLCSLYLFQVSRLIRIYNTFVNINPEFYTLITQDLWAICTPRISITNGFCF